MTFLKIELIDKIITNLYKAALSKNTRNMEKNKQRQKMVIGFMIQSKGFKPKLIGTFGFEGQLF
jgi:hypothetical protein